MDYLCIRPIHLIIKNFIFLGRGMGMLVASFIYIVIQQRLLFLVFGIFNIIAAIIYSIYFLLTREKTSSKKVNISNKDDTLIAIGNFIY
jgi:hypothetical protein